MARPARRSFVLNVMLRMRWRVEGAEGEGNGGMASLYSGCILKISTLPKVLLPSRPNNRSRQRGGGAVSSLLRPLLPGERSVSKTHGGIIACCRAVSFMRRFFAHSQATATPARGIERALKSEWHTAHDPSSNWSEITPQRDRLDEI